MSKGYVKDFCNDKCFCYAMLKITESAINMSKICFFSNKKPSVFYELKKYAQVDIFDVLDNQTCKIFALVGEFDLGIKFCKNMVYFFSGNGNYLSNQKWLELKKEYDYACLLNEQQLNDKMMALTKNIKNCTKKTERLLPKQEILNIIKAGKKYKTIIKV